MVAFVLMPNHLHFIVFIQNDAKASLNKIIGNLKRFWAYEIVKRLKEQGKAKLLKVLSNGVQSNEKKNGKKHQVFRLSFDARICDSIKLLEQKIEYIHANPVSGKWNLVNDYLAYQHSSAKYYDDDLAKPLFLKDYRDILN